MGITYLNNNEQLIIGFLQKQGITGRREEISLRPLSGDGSSRLFFKINTDAGASFCGVLPGCENLKKGAAEAHARNRRL